MPLSASIGCPRTPRPVLARTRWLAALVSLVLCALLLWITDRVLGLVFPFLRAAVISSPGSTARFVTDEFDVVAHNNHLGLRGAEIDEVRPAGTRRVLALGDSFTWGWGVSDSASWPAVLNRLFLTNSTPIEVINGGQPGAYPALYAENARKIIPVLRPDLVVVGILQGDDIEQIHRRFAPVSRWKAMKDATFAALPNLTGLAIRLRNRLTPLSSVGWQWQRQAAGIVASLSEVERHRLARIDPNLRRAFESGRFNPFLFQIALQFPDFFTHATRLNDLESAIMTMADSLRDIVQAAASHGSEVLVVGIPYPVYVCRATLESQRRLGFELDDSLLHTDQPDLAIRKASDLAGVPFVSLTDAFRARAATETLFFPFDGHPNEAGHRFLAERIAPVIQDRLRRSRPEAIPVENQSMSNRLAR